MDSLAVVAFAQSDVSTAELLGDDALERFRDLNDRWGIAQTLRTVGRVAAARGLMHRAAAHFRESLLLFRELDDTYDLTLVLASIGELALSSRHCTDGTRVLAAAEALREKVGASLPPIELADLERQVTSARTLLEDDVFASAWSEGMRMTLDEAVANAQRPLAAEQLAR